jgi:hypothetical protein
LRAPDLDRREHDATLVVGRDVETASVKRLGCEAD